MGLGRADLEMRRRVAAGEVAGIATAVVDGGDVVEACYGMLDIERAVPVRPDSIMRVYSLTKPVVATAVMILRERGLLNLDDPVRRWIESFGTLRVLDEDSSTFEPLHGDITVRHLLTHTAGLGYGFQEGTVEALCRDAGLLSPILRWCHPLERSVDIIAGLPLVAQPGTRWHYSASYDVLGYLIELVSERALGDFLQEEIFRPLGMVDTGFVVPPTKLDRFGPLYAPPQDGEFQVLDPSEGSAFADGGAPPSGGGGLVSTLRDYVRFSRLLLAGGSVDGVRIISGGVARELVTNQLDGVAFPMPSDAVADEAGYGYGVGVQIGKDNKYGWGGASGCTFWVFPDRDLIAVALTQSFVDFTVSDAFIEAVAAPD